MSVTVIAEPWLEVTSQVSGEVMRAVPPIASMATPAASSIRIAVPPGARVGGAIRIGLTTVAPTESALRNSRSRRERWTMPVQARREGS